MRTLKLLATTLLVASLAATPLTALAGNGKQGNGGRPVTAAVAATALVPLTEDEIATLLWMRQEEKLARDVYIAMTGVYPGAKIFATIAAAEQKHFDSLGKKIDLYGLTALDETPAAVGEFSYPDLSQAYTDLVEAGNAGYVEALFAGVDIEEADLEELWLAIDETDSRPLKKTYSHLLIGSQHHLDSFIKLLEKEGVDYEP